MLTCVGFLVDLVQVLVKGGTFGERAGSASLVQEVCRNLNSYSTHNMPVESSQVYGAEYASNLVPVLINSTQKNDVEPCFGKKGAACEMMLTTALLAFHVSQKFRGLGHPSRGHKC